MADKQGKKPGKKSTPAKAISRTKPQTQTQAKPKEKVITPSKPHLSKEVRTWGMFCHLGAFAGYIIPFGNIIGPLIIWLAKREDNPFIDAQGRESVNFQISFTLYMCIAFLLIFVFIGFLLIPLLILLQFIFIIVASLKAQDGEVYHYPLSIRFL